MDERLQALLRAVQINPISHGRRAADLTDLGPNIDKAMSSSASVGGVSDHGSGSSSFVDAAGASASDGGDLPFFQVQNLQFRV